MICNDFIYYNNSNACVTSNETRTEEFSTVFPRLRFGSCFLSVRCATSWCLSFDKLTRRIIVSLRCHFSCWKRSKPSSSLQTRIPYLRRPFTWWFLPQTFVLSLFLYLFTPWECATVATGDTAERTRASVQRLMKNFACNRVLWWSVVTSDVGYHLYQSRNHDHMLLISCQTRRFLITRENIFWVIHDVLGVEFENNNYSGGDSENKLTR